MTFVFPDKILCKNCGVEIQSLREFREGIGTLSPNNNYKEIEIEFEDGTKHITSLCSDCISRLKTEDLQKIYDKDLKQWQLEGLSLNDHLIMRKPIGFN